MNEEALPRPDQQALLLDEWVQARREAAMCEARAARIMAERVALFDEDVAEQPLQREAIWRSMVAEFSAAGHMAKSSVEHAFTDAHFLHDDFPALSASFASGDVTIAHVRDIIRAASPVRQAVADGTADPSVLAVYEAAAVDFAEHESPSRTRAHVREVAAALVGQTVTERHRAAQSEQYVSVRPIDDQLSLLQALLPTERAVAIMDRLTQMARHQKNHPEHREPTLPPMEPEPLPDFVPADAVADEFPSDAIFGVADTFTVDPFQPGEPAHVESWIPDSIYPHDPEDFDECCEQIDRSIAAGPQILHIPADTRSLDHIRADLLSDLLLAADPSSVQGTGLEKIHARIQVTISASTLTGEDDNPAGLDGHGTLHPDTARVLAGMNRGWTRLFLDPTGMVTQTDTYSPTEPMCRYLRARDQHCRFPGCRMPPHRCEVDHTHDYARGGPTALDNLAHLCRAHHALKHPDVPDQHRWRVRQLPDWTLVWASPSGRVHTDSPPRRVMFVPSEAQPPGDRDDHRTLPDPWHVPASDSEHPADAPF